MYLAWLCALLSGAGLPLFAQFIQRMWNSFGSSVTKEDTLDSVTNMYIAMVCIGAFIGLCSFAFWMILLRFSNTVAKRTKENYLAAILKQEQAWFDVNNSNELCAKMTKECMAINLATGEKVGTLLTSLGMCLCGLIIGIVNGWSLALAYLAVGPVLGFGAVNFGGKAVSKFMRGLAGYAQSSGYAEQALSSIKVVLAFGMESIEIKNYTKFLTKSRDEGRAAGFGLAIAVAFFIGGLFLSYSYGFWLGGIWIDRGYENDILGRKYLGGDILCVFWGVIFGLFALSSTFPNSKALIEGRAAGRSTYNTIGREPTIKADSGAKTEVAGSIEFKDVSFYYPTRTDQTILQDFNVKFETGKTTAIVGASGSGKSTIVQLLMRFYDPTAGTILIDGKPLPE
jgi:ATP-binding cassette, subfamily B (MDR/TAP), member 1